MQRPEKEAEIRIRPFVPDDLEAAGRIALHLWGDEVKEMPLGIRPLIYHYLAHYYYLASSPYNLAAEADGRLCAFLMAAPGGMEKTQEAEKWINAHLHDEEQERFFREYRAYLESNRLAERAACREKELLLLFFASIRPGSGRLLLQYLESLCRRDGIPSLLLWSDETCDFDYYRKHRFAEAGSFLCPAPLCGHHFATWLFRKEFL